MVRGARFDIVITKPAGVTTSNAQGRPVEGQPTTTSTRGSLDLLSAREVERAAAMGLRATASARVDHGTDVDETCTLEATGTLPAPDEQIAGSWLVAAVQHTRTHLRVLLRRSG